MKKRNQETARESAHRSGKAVKGVSARVQGDTPEPAEKTGVTSPADGHSRARAALPAICERLRGGTPVNHAAALEGVPRSSFYALLDADEDAQTLVTAARAEAAERLRANVVQLAQGGEDVRGSNPNVLLHLMERLYPDTYVPPKQRVEQELSGPGGVPVQHQHSYLEKLSDDELAAKAEAAARLLRGGGQ